LERKDRIAELCNRATTENDPATLKKILDELKTSLAEYMREARHMTLLHFDYFRKHQKFSPESWSPNDREIEKKELIDRNENKNENRDFLQATKKKAS
jgi:hypothetical protein